MPTLNIKSTQQAIKVGEHKGEEMFVMKVDYLFRQGRPRGEEKRKSRRLIA